MTEGILFSVGFIVFIATTTATLLFGYFQFNRIYREDRIADERGFSVGLQEDGYEVMQPAGQPDLKVIAAESG